MRTVGSSGPSEFPYKGAHDFHEDALQAMLN
jgi:hypothetical protein